MDRQGKEYKTASSYPFRNRILLKIMGRQLVIKNAGGKNPYKQFHK